MHTSPIHRAAPGLPTATLEEIHDCLVLALDATGGQPQHWQVDEARSYMRTALRRTKIVLKGGRE